MLGPFFCLRNLKSAGNSWYRCAFVCSLFVVWAFLVSMLKGQQVLIRLSCQSLASAMGKPRIWQVVREGFISESGSDRVQLGIVQSCWRPGQRASGRPSRKKHFGAEIHEPKVPHDAKGGSEKLRSEKSGWLFGIEMFFFWSRDFCWSSFRYQESR